ncbi:RepB family DNA primase [Qipengyuania sp. 6B39]|uniref:primase-helicase family protein n=1 Tax=Qipengyuania proteolytica TaxID=2867239 RepID=UPI001C8AE60E|nr:primase-helicase family protein [Qipengyuania proteolytica]MBX7496850.1 RepB family DNA primase [Qipengyuania proteolytica]
MGEWIQRHNLVERYNIYFMLNTPTHDLTKKAKKRDTKWMIGGHVDIDPRKPPNDATEAEKVQHYAREREAAATKLRDFKPAPSLKIDSGGGMQGIWLFEDPLYIGGNEAAAEDAELYNQHLETVLGGDSCHNVDRVLRLPGTINWKEGDGRKPRLARLVSPLEGELPKRYRVAEFTAASARKASVTSGQAKVQLEGIPAPIDLDTLPAAVTPRTRMLIVQGDDPDDPLRYSSRSEVTFAVVCEMVRAGCTDEQIAAVIADPDLGISAHTLAQKQTRAYVERQIERARAEVEEPMLRELNGKHFAVGSIGGKFRIASPRRSEIDEGRECLEYQTVADFKNRYMNLKVQCGTDGNNNPKMVPAGDWWLKHPMRRQYETIVFAPGENTDELHEYNLWRGLAVTPEPHSWPLLHRLIHEGLAGGNAEYAEYIMRWLAFAVQHPERAAEVALVFRGKRGVGKSTLGHAMRRIFGQHGMSVTHPQHLHGQFNDHLHDCILLFADEAVAPGEKKAEQMIKVMITEPTLLIEPKGLGKFTAKNRLHVMMASNERWVVPAGADERRFAIFDVSPHLAARPGDPNEERNRAFWDALYDEINGEGLQGFLYDLLAMDLGNWHPRRGVPQTAALNEQKAASLTGFKGVFFDLLKTGELPQLQAVRDCGGGHVFVSTSELLEYAQKRTRRDDMTLNEVGELLDNLGCMRDGRRRPRGWVMPPLEEIRRKWDEIEFPGAWQPTPGWGVGSAAPDENDPY